ncbi:MAG: hypothetical protein RL173_18 [Fibrobacterota bacterium]
MSLLESERNLVVFQNSHLFIKGFGHRDFVSEILRLTQIAQSRLTTKGGPIIPNLLLTIDKTVYRGAIVAFRSSVDFIECRHEWLNCLIELAKTLPPKSIVWLEQGLFYWVDDFAVILPPLRFQSDDLVEKCISDVDVCALTGAKISYKEILEMRRLNLEDREYRELF